MTSRGASAGKRRGRRTSSLGLRAALEKARSAARVGWDRRSAAWDRRSLSAALRGGNPAQSERRVEDENRHRLQEILSCGIHAAGPVPVGWHGKSPLQSRPRYGARRATEGKWARTETGPASRRLSRSSAPERTFVLPLLRRGRTVSVFFYLRTVSLSHVVPSTLRLSLQPRRRAAAPGPRYTYSGSGRAASRRATRNPHFRKAAEVRLRSAVPQAEEFQVPSCSRSGSD